MKTRLNAWRGIKLFFLLALAVNLILMEFGNQVFLEILFRPRGNAAFDRNIWSKNVEGGIRYEMADSLISSNLLLGKKRSQVEELLGSPMYTVEGASHGDFRLTYMLSLQHSHPARFFLLPFIGRGNSDCWILCVEFKGHLVASVYVGVT
jgi:hypothetical protein